MAGFGLPALVVAGVVSCAGTPPDAPAPAEPPRASATADAVPQAGAAATEEDDAPLLDRTQQRVFTVVNSTSQWFDGFFGSPRLNQEIDEDADITRGLLAVGAAWDERDEFDSRFRLRAQFPLPALKERTRLLLGRGDTQSLVSGSETETLNTLPDQFSDFTDDNWLLGLGYREGRAFENGWDFGLGASLSSGAIDPYVQATYNWHKTWGENWLWRLNPRVFWREQRGEGASVNSILDYVVGPSWLLRSWITLITDQEIEGMAWTTDFLAYQSIDEHNALSWRVYASGETGSPVELQNYGVELRYRRRILREWLFLELSTGVSWPREFVTEMRNSNLGVGVEIEMQFGDWPGREQQTRGQPD